MVLQILPRSAWTTTKNGWPENLVKSRIKGFAIHYPGDGNVIRKGNTRAQNAALIRAYRNWQAVNPSGRGWPDIGYCFAVDQNGEAWTLAGEKVAAHSATPSYSTANRDLIGILLILGNNETPTSAMIATLNALMGHLRTKYPNARQIMGHRQVPGASTSCPGTAVVNRINNGTIKVGGSAPAPKPQPSKPVTDAEKARVKKFQQKLKDMGLYKGLIDGDELDMTIAATLKFQKDLNTYALAGLVEDGRWGSVTENWWAWVGAVQKALNGYKSDLPKLLVDHHYGPVMSRTVVHIQGRNGLHPDGMVGPVMIGWMRGHGSTVPNRPKNRP